MSAEEKSDAQLLGESLASPALFGVLVDRYQAAFLRKAIYILRNVDEAEDAVQETFVKIYSHGGKFAEQPGASFSSWAYKILLNTCFNRYKKLKRESELVAKIDAPILALAPSRDEEYFEDKLRLDYAVSLLGTLPAVLRRVMTLHFLKGWSYDEVAEAEGVSAGAIRTRIHRAKKLLKCKI